MTAKTNLERDSISRQHCLEKVRRSSTLRHTPFTDTRLVATITAAGVKAVKTLNPLIGGLLIALLSIVGCSDVPYTGSMLTPEDVDRYITIGEDAACVVRGDASTCMTLIPETEDASQPVIHIHPRKLVYVFYHEGVQIIQAELMMDTTEIIAQVIALEEEAGSTQQSDAGDDSTQQSDAGDDSTQQSDAEAPFDESNSGEDNRGGGGGGGGGSGVIGGTGERNKVKVRGGSEASLISGLINLSIRTGSHESFSCPTGLQTRTVTAYTDSGFNEVRAHQHWSGCEDTAKNIFTIFLYNHPELTCDVRPNTHYLKVDGSRGSITLQITETCPW